jgi:hypothetical protein
MMRSGGRCSWLNPVAWGSRCGGSARWPNQRLRLTAPTHRLGLTAQPTDSGRRSNPAVQPCRPTLPSCRPALPPSAADSRVGLARRTCAAAGPAWRAVRRPARWLAWSDTTARIGDLVGQPESADGASPKANGASVLSSRDGRLLRRSPSTHGQLSAAETQATDRERSDDAATVLDHAAGAAILPSSTTLPNTCIALTFAVGRSGSWADILLAFSALALLCVGLPLRWPSSALAFL